MKGFGSCFFFQLQLVVACVHGWEYVDYLYVRGVLVWWLRLKSILFAHWCCARD